MPALENKVVIVTGASHGAGRAIALMLAREGAKVVAVARNKQELDSLAAEITAKEGACEVVVGDVTKLADTRRLAQHALERFGRIDALINNAGVGGPVSRVEETSLEEWQRTLEVNLTGPFLCSQAVLPAMQEQGGGHIVMISSGAGKQGYPNMAAYCASKFGLHGLAQSLAAEVSDMNIRVTTLIPGSIAETSFSGQRKGWVPRPGAKYLRPEDLGHAVLYLLQQPASAWTQEMNLWPFKTYP
ncbi:MAG TPA: SDR family oxidoreductase [Ktedonobacterales bacterium]|jgi:NAD(P)-dependent dehydrogenase (short-subunit alcohol dehydrogenase family)